MFNILIDTVSLITHIKIDESDNFEDRYLNEFLDSFKYSYKINLIKEPIKLSNILHIYEIIEKMEFDSLLKNMNG